MNVRHAQASPGRLQAHGVRWAWHAIGAHIWWLLMAGRALVTGATGFVGRRLASALGQFRGQFWEHDDGILGGTTAIDLPIRRIVYPSHGGPDERRGVLLASYTWGQDAACWGALTPEDGVALALKDLAKIHPQAPDELEAGASYAWYNDPHAGGAFALFEPGQESALQAHMLMPEGRVHFAVEHCSLWHAWMPGVPSTRRRSRPPLGAQVAEPQAGSTRHPSAAAPREGCVDRADWRDSRSTRPLSHETRAPRGEDVAIPDLMSALQPDKGHGVSAYLEPVAFPAGGYIFREGAPADGCFVLDGGEVRIEVESDEVDTETVLGYITPPSVLGEVGLLDGMPRSASAFAHTDVTARRMSVESLDRLCRDRPKAGAALLRTLGREAAHKLRMSNERVAGQILAEPDADTDRVVAAAVAAQVEFAAWREDRVDALLRDVAAAVAERAVELAAATVAETAMGNVADKAAKNRFAALAVCESLVGRPASGLLRTDAERRVTEIASPVGVVFGLIPLTNPVATVVNKVLICLKARNALILSCHRGAQGVAAATGELIRAVLERHGAPDGLFQGVAGRTSRHKTMMFMRHPGVGLILATGGPGMVRAAYSAGKPAIGVGSGNAPALICADADVGSAASAVVSSKAFDHGVICGSEQHLVVERSVHESFAGALEQEGAALLDRRETTALLATVFDRDTGSLLKRYAGRSAEEIARAAGIGRDRPIRLLVFTAPEGELEDGPVSRERLAPLLSLFVVENFEAGLALCRQLLAVEGAGHTAAIHTRSRERAQRFGVTMPASRILMNMPAAQGCVGMGNGLTPSLTLGCGTFGGNSTTDNVGYMNLINIKRLAEPIP